MIVFLKNWLASLTVLSIVIVFACSCAPVNYPPAITSLEAEREVIPPSECCQIKCVASDPEAGELNYEWSVMGGTISGNGSSVTWTAPDEPGKYTISVSVIDEKANKAAESVIITVRENHPPEITDLKVSPGLKVKYGRACTITCVAQDADGDELSYGWSANRGGISAEGNIATWTAPNCDGTYDIIVEVKDSLGGEVTRTVQIKVGHG
jgi:hypothetical protein